MSGGPQEFNVSTEIFVLARDYGFESKGADKVLKHQYHELQHKSPAILIINV